MLSQGFSLRLLTTFHRLCCIVISCLAFRLSAGSEGALLHVALPLPSHVPLTATLLNTQCKLLSTCRRPVDSPTLDVSANVVV